jgi:hypothetical protein
MDQAIGYALSQVTQAISELEPQTQLSNPRPSYSEL